MVLVRNRFGIEHETTEKIASELVARGELEYVVEAPKKAKEEPTSKKAKEEPTE